MPNGREDLRVAVTFLTHIKTRRLQRECGHEGIVCLLRLWAYAAGNFPSTGKFTRVEDIEEAAEWTGSGGKLIAALRGIGWIDEDGLTLHDWIDEQPYVSGKMDRMNDARVNGRLGGLKRAANAASKNPQGLLDAPMKGTFAASKTLEAPLKGGLNTLASPSSGALKTLQGLQPPIPSLPVPSLPDLTQPEEGGGPPSRPPPSLVHAVLIQTAEDLALKLSDAISDPNLTVCRTVLLELLVAGVTEEFLRSRISYAPAPVGAWAWKTLVLTEWKRDLPPKAKAGEIPYPQPNTDGAYSRGVAAEREAAAKRGQTGTRPASMERIQA